MAVGRCFAPREGVQTLEDYFGLKDKESKDKFDCNVRIRNNENYIGPASFLSSGQTCRVIFEGVTKLYSLSVFDPGEAVAPLPTQFRSPCLVHLKKLRDGSAGR